MTLANGGLPEAAAASTGLLPVGAAAAYLVAVIRLRRARRCWSRWRTASFVGGAVLLAAALSGPVARAAEDGFAGHVLQHLLVGMLAPLALVLGAPVTLALRAAGTRATRGLVRVLRSRASRALATPAGVLVLTAGGLYLLYLTPVYRATLEHPTLHHLVHLHVLVSGYLFCWVVAGPDPVPRRATVPARLLVLGVAVVGQTVLSQLISADVLVDIAAPAGQRRAGAALMHYGGDLVQLLLALAVVANWRPARSPRFEDKAV